MADMSLRRAPANGCVEPATTHYTDGKNMVKGRALGLCVGRRRRPLQDGKDGGMPTGEEKMDVFEYACFCTTISGQMSKKRVTEETPGE